MAGVVLDTGIAGVCTLPVGSLLNVSDSPGHERLHLYQLFVPKFPECDLNNLLMGCELTELTIDLPIRMPINDDFHSSILTTDD